jgi:hypothetical protein
MNTFALFFLSLSLLIGVVVTILAQTDNKWRKPKWKESLAEGATWGGWCVAIVLAIWLFMAFPFSTYERNSCKAEANGYDLGYDWSLRNGCRIVLPSGQLVSSDKIRITSDGEIVTGSEG